MPGATEPKANSSRFSLSGSHRAESYRAESDRLEPRRLKPRQWELPALEGFSVMRARTGCQERGITASFSVMKTLWLAWLLALLASSCVGPQSDRVARDDGWQVLVLSVRIPDTMPWYSRLAEHMWVDVRRGDEETWWRLEVTGSSSGVDVSEVDLEEVRSTERWGNRAYVLASLEGEEARAAADRLLHLAKEHPDFGRWETVMTDPKTSEMRFHEPDREEYEAWPGPNSNTFVSDLVAAVPELDVELHHNGIGKNYARGVHFGGTAGGYGVAVDTNYLGLGLGLREGVELHLVGLTAGVSLWPPALKLPFVPRLGVHQGWVNGGL